jgi:hypothetical protein
MTRNSDASWLDDIVTRQRAINGARMTSLIASCASIDLTGGDMDAWERACDATCETIGHQECGRCGEAMRDSDACAEIATRDGDVLIIHQECMRDGDTIA